MRNPDRIKPFLKKLEILWEKCPDLRFGQLVKNIEHRVSGKAELFYIEDEEFEKEIDAFEVRAWPTLEGRLNQPLTSLKEAKKQLKESLES
jgi:hypothetical protein